MNILGTLEEIAGLKLGKSGQDLTITPDTLTADRTITLPDADDTLVGKATTDTLTNKKIGDTVGAGTGTIVPDLTGTSTELTLKSAHTAARTLTLPDATDTLVGRATTDTLTNKSIDADTNTITNIEDADIKAGAAISRAKLASGTANEVLINDGTGAPSSEAQLAKTRGGTGITSTATFPASGIIVTEGATQTLSAKTLTSPKTNNIVINDTGSDLNIGTNAVGPQKINLGATGMTTVIKGSLEVQGATITANTTTLDVEDANLTINKGGTKNTADTTPAGITVERTDSTNVGLTYDDSAALKWKAGVIGSGDPIVGEAATQTLTNKTLTSPDINEIINTGTLSLPTSTDTLVGRDTTDTLTNKTLDAPAITGVSTWSEAGEPAAPAAGQHALYFNSSDGGLYTKNNAGDNVKVGSDSSASGTGINYIENSNADINLDGWTAGGGIVLDRVQTNLPRGSINPNAFEADSSAASAEDYVSTTWTIGEVDKNKRLSLSVGLHVAQTADETFRVELWRDGGTVEVPLQSDNPDGDTLLLAGVSELKTTFDSDDTDDYELRIVTNVAPTAGDVVTFGDVFVGPLDVVSIPAPANSEIMVEDIAGWGSTGIYTIRYANLVTNIGSAITYTSDAVNGDYVTINEDGVYSFFARLRYNDDPSSGTVYVTRNYDPASEPSLAPPADILAGSTEQYKDGSAGVDHVTTSGTRILKAGDIVRVQSSGGNLHTNDRNYIQFSVTQVESHKGTEYLTNIDKKSPVRAGMIMAWPDDTIPQGWVECDGSTLSVTTYPELFATIGYKYQATQSGSTFTLPNYRGEFLRGHSNGSGTDPDAVTRTDRGDGIAGDNVGTKQADQAGPHGHSDNFSTSSNGAHDHTGAGGMGMFNSLRWAGTGTAYNFVRSTYNSGATITNNTGNHTHTINGSVTNLSTSESRPTNVAVKWIIKLYNDSIDTAGFGMASADSAGLLSAYEEGTWTPSVDSFDDMSGTAVFDTCTYTRVGRLVTARIKVINGLSINNVAESGDRRIAMILNPTGLPGTSNGCVYSGGAHCRTGASTYISLGCRVSTASDSNDKIYVIVENNINNNDADGLDNQGIDMYSMSFTYEIV